MNCKIYHPPMGFSFVIRRRQTANVVLDFASGAKVVWFHSSIDSRLTGASGSFTLLSG